MAKKRKGINSLGSTTSDIAETIIDATTLNTPPIVGTTSASANSNTHPIAPDEPPTPPSSITTINPEEIKNLEQAYLVFIETYRNKPVEFVETVLQAKPLDWQRQFLNAIARGERRISVRAGHGVGKALHIKEPVLTPHGWVPIGAMRVGDKVATVDGTFTDVIGVYPQGQRELYRVTLDDGCSVVVDKEHRWTTWTRKERANKRPSQVRTTAEIAETLLHKNGKTPALNHMIPTVEAIEHPTALLPVEPYLLGVWLGDGCCDGRITAGKDIIQQVEAVGGQWLTQTKVKHSDKVVIAGCEGLVSSLRFLNLFGDRSHQKRIPRVYMHGSISQRVALLQGLLDTDGTVGQNNNSVVFDITSKDLADDISELVRSLGGVATRSEKIGQYNGKQCKRVYRCFISLPRDVAPFRTPYKTNRYKPDWDHHNRKKVTRRFIKSIEPAGLGEAVCISVAHPSQLFVTKDHIVTHNSTACSWALIWFMLTRYPQKSVLTAPTAGQLFDALFAEVKRWVNALPPFLKENIETYSDRITHKHAPESSFMSARTSSADRPEALAGVHSENVLLICDEASAIPEAVYESAAGSMSGHSATTILIGNPTRNSGLFFRTHHELKSDWFTMHVSCMNNPLVSVDFVKQIRTTYGDNSNAFRVRVLGEFALREDDVLIAAELVESAMDRDITLDPKEPIVYGVDVARYGNDRTVILKRQGQIVIEIKSWDGADTMETVGRIVHEAKIDKPSEICVDSIGLGAGVADRLREQGYNVRDVNVAEASALNPQAARLRDELWLSVRDWLNTRTCKLPKNEDLRTELCTPTYSFTSTGKIKVEGKAEMKRRGFRSPDLADALCLTFAGTAASVGGRASRWVVGKPLKRNVSGVV